MGNRSPFRSRPPSAEKGTPPMRSAHRVALATTVAALAAVVLTQTLHPLHAAEPAGAGSAQSSATAGLRLVAAQAVRALLVDDGSRLPKATGFRYTENGQPLTIGDGMW